VGQRVTPAANDKEQLAPLLQVIEPQSGQRPAVLLADRGLLLGEESQVAGDCETAYHRIDAYIATGKQKPDEYRRPCPRGPLPTNATPVERLMRKLQTKAGRAVYAARKTLVEPVFGQIKEARGFSPLSSARLKNRIARARGRQSKRTWGKLTLRLAVELIGGSGVRRIHLGHPGRRLYIRM
jgi:hypothetical protein